MNSKKITILWSISLFIVGGIGILLGVTNLLGIDLPDIVVRLAGVFDILAVPVLAFTTVKKVNFKKPE